MCRVRNKYHQCSTKPTDSVDIMEFNSEKLEYNLDFAID